jgi:hypothetical protein
LKVWTRQSAKAWEELQKNGVFRIKKKYISRKYGALSNTFMVCYEWLANKASEYLDRPEGAEGPIWLAIRLDFMPCPADNTVVLELEIESKNLLVFDMGKWDMILNYWYIPFDEEDGRSFRKLLDEKGIRNQSEVMMTQFHPVLKRVMMESWGRLFDENIRVSSNDQAICWEIKREWVTSVDGKACSL